MSGEDWAADIRVEVFDSVGNPTDVACGESEMGGAKLVAVENSSDGSSEPGRDIGTQEAPSEGYLKLLLKRKDSRIYYYRKEMETLRGQVGRAENEVRRLQAGLADIVTNASLTEDVMLARLRQYGALDEGVACAAVPHPLQMLQDSAMNLLGNRYFVIPRGTPQQFVVCKHRTGCYVRVGVNMPQQAVYGVFYASPTNLPVAFKVDHRVADGVTMLGSENYTYANTINVE